MAILGLRTPHDVARLLGQIEVPGERVPGDEKHVTLLHLGKDVPIETVSRAMVGAYEVASTTVPFTLQVHEAKCFEPGDDGTPIVCPVVSTEIYELWGALCKAMGRAGVDYSKKWPIFMPHITLSYAKEPQDPFPVGPFEWSVYEMVLWGGDSGDERVSVTFPFSLPGKEALWRRLVRAHLLFPSGIVP
jgi:2'-5' RNA ligase